MARFTDLERCLALDDISAGIHPETGENIADEKLYTATEAAKRFKIRPETIMMWRKAGKLQPVAHEGRSPLYAWGDLKEVERATRRSGHSFRVPRARREPDAR